MSRIKVLMLLLMLILFQIPLVYPVGVRYPVPHDVILYRYGNRVIKYSYYSLEYALMNNSYSLVLANRTLTETKRIYIEEEFYKSKGITTRGMKFIKYLHVFSGDSLTLTVLLLRFERGNKSKLAPGVLAALQRIEVDIKTLSSFPLYNGSKRLYLNFQPLKALLERIKNLVKPYYKRIPPKMSFFIATNTLHPYINQSVLVFGSAPAKGNIELVITGNESKTLWINSTMRTFSVWLKFNLPGRYTIQAFQNGNHSNVVEIIVGRVPTRIVAPSRLNALIGERVEVSAILVDAWGRPLPGFSIYINGKRAITDSNGKVNVSVYSDVFKTIPITFEFKGNDKYLESKKTVQVFFTKKPVHLYLSAKKSEIQIGENATITLMMVPPIGGYIDIYVNGSLRKTIWIKERANFTLRMSTEGTWAIRACFNGTENYSAACSNTILVRVERPPSPLSKVKTVVTVTALLGIVTLATKFRKRTTFVTELPQEESIITPPSIPRDVGKAYTLVRNVIVERFGLPTGLTPREILEYLQDFPARDSLENLTEIHELHVYAGKDVDIDEYLNHIYRILEVIGK